ncbi:MAG TPA: Ig-like domain-containing protein, partial [Anaeromyxobacteraceae bacterium]|nr:Ig-like domain-containing protein [Anaeromyxobacteraceae bacterium]
LHATAHYGDGSTADVTASAAWSIPGVHYIGAPVYFTLAGGLVTGVAFGGGQVQADYGGKTGAATVNVTSARLVSIALTPADSSVQTGATLQLVATGTYTDGSTANVSATAYWTVTPSFATVASPGVVTGVTPGTATVTATQATISGSTSVTVVQATLQSVTVEPAQATLAAGLTLQLAAKAHWSNGTTQDVTTQATWSSDRAAATVSSAGLATGVAQGTANLTASYGGFSGACALTVTAVALQSIAVTPANPSLVEGFTQQLTATGTYTDGHTADLTSQVTWASSATASATVGTAGLVTAQAPGSAQVSASLGGRSGAVTVTVTALGASWQQISTAGSPAAVTTSDLYGVAWCTNQFVAVGTGGTILTSPDGTTWTARTSNDSRALYAVACSASRILAVGNSGTSGAAASSTDGVTWMAEPSPAPGGTGSVWAIAWNGTTFVAGGDSYSIGDPSAPWPNYGLLGLTADGSSWTATSTLGDSVRGIAWSGSRFLAGGDYGAFTSTDGVTWTTGAGRLIRGIAWTGTTFVEVAQSGVVWLVGADGSSITGYLGAGTSNDLNGVVWTGRALFAVGNGGVVFSSPAGDSWTARPSGTSSNLRAAAWSGSRLVAVGDGGTIIAAP